MEQAECGTKAANMMTLKMSMEVESTFGITCHAERDNMYALYCVCVPSH